MCSHTAMQRTTWGPSGPPPFTLAEEWLGRPLAAPSPQELVVRPGRRHRPRYLADRAPARRRHPPPGAVRAPGHPDRTALASEGARLLAFAADAPDDDVRLTPPDRLPTAILGVMDDACGTTSTPSTPSTGPCSSASTA
jgi:hypothetical protein